MRHSFRVYLLSAVMFSLAACYFDQDPSGVYSDFPEDFIVVNNYDFRSDHTVFYHYSRLRPGSDTGRYASGKLFGTWKREGKSIKVRWQSGDQIEIKLEGQDLIFPGGFRFAKVR